jgi:hypothetical protein
MNKTLGTFSVGLLGGVAMIAACTTTTVTTITEGDAGAGGETNTSKRRPGTSTSSGDTSTSSSSGTSGTTSSGSTTSSTSGGAVDAGTSKCVGSGTVNAAANPVDAGGCPAPVVYSSADLDQEVGWRCPAVAKGACSLQELATIEANFDTATTYADLGNGIGAPCKACAISSASDPTWGPIVVTSAGGAGFVNWGACAGALEGASCGKALVYINFCIDDACGCSSASACVSTATGPGGTCSSYRAALDAACPDFDNTVETCGSALDAIKLLCGP